MKLGSCLLLGIVAITLVVFWFAVSAAFIQVAWNYVVVDALELASKHMTYKIAVIVTVALSIVGGMFRSTSK